MSPKFLVLGPKLVLLLILLAVSNLGNGPEGYFAVDPTGCECDEGDERIRLTDSQSGDTWVRLLEEEERTVTAEWTGGNTEGLTWSIKQKPSSLTVNLDQTQVTSPNSNPGTIKVTGAKKIVPQTTTLFEALFIHECDPRASETYMGVEAALAEGGTPTRTMSIYGYPSYIGFLDPQEPRGGGVIDAEKARNQGISVIEKTISLEMKDTLNETVWRFSYVLTGPGSQGILAQGGTTPPDTVPQDPRRGSNSALITLQIPTAIPADCPAEGKCQQDLNLRVKARRISSIFDSIGRERNLPMTVIYRSNQ